MESEKNSMVYITKYALTKGIIAAIGKANDDGSVSVKTKNFIVYYKGNEWHEDQENALRKAEEMRLKKIVSLQKQIAKLQNLKF